MALADKRRSGEVAQVECLHLACLDARVRQGLLARIDGKRTKVPVGKCSERRLTQPDYGYRSHTTIRIAPQYKFVCTFSPSVRQYFLGR